MKQFKFLLDGLKLATVIILATLLVLWLSMTTPQDISDMVTQCSYDMSINQELICD